MARTLRIDFCCNDPDNGNFAGRAIGASFSDCELEPPNYDFGYRLSLTKRGVRIHGRSFAVLASKDWVGNWCWNSYSFDRPEGVRLLLTLREKGWRCTDGPTRLYDWFNRREVA